METDPLEVGMTYVEKLDFREQAHRHQLELEAEKTRRTVLEQKGRKAASRHEMMTYIGVAALVVTLILGIVYFIYEGTRPGPYSDKPDKSERREIACMNAGGTWLPAGVVVGDDPVCIMPGKAPTNQ